MSPQNRASLKTEMRLPVPPAPCTVSAPSALICAEWMPSLWPKLDADLPAHLKLPQVKGCYPFSQMRTWGAGMVTYPGSQASEVRVWLLGVGFPWESRAEAHVTSPQCSPLSEEQGQLGLRGSYKRATERYRLRSRVGTPWLGGRQRAGKAACQWRPLNNGE